MIAHHCSYWYKGLHHMLLEHADLGTLEDFMQHQPPPSSNAMVAKFWQNMLRIIDPIVMLQNRDLETEAAHSTQSFIRFVRQFPSSVLLCKHNTHQ